MNNMTKITALIELLTKIHKELGEDLDVVIASGKMFNSITTANTLQVTKIGNEEYVESDKSKTLVIELA